MNRLADPPWATPLSGPRAAAAAALAELPAPEPVPAISLAAGKRLAIVGPAEAVLGWAERLAGQREVTALIRGPLPGAGGLPGTTAGASAATSAETSGFALEAGEDFTLTGHLGAFDLRWQPAALSAVLPATQQVTPHAAQQTARQATFDAVLDLSPEPLLNRIELPTGYAAPGRDPLDQALAVIDLLGFEGEFEKPRYVALNDKLCAHSRSQKAGCSNCIEVCSTQAISGFGDSIKLDPYLCQGCGTCATVCPSGALAYQYPRVPDLGLAIKVQLAAYRAAGGESPCLLFHSRESGRRLLTDLQRRGQALPDHVIPVESWSVDAIGIDLLLGAVTLGASRVAVLGAGPHDLAPLRRQVGLGQAVLSGLGYGGEYLRLIDPEHPAWLADLASWPAPAGLPPAEFRLLPAKRTSLEFVLDHLIRHAPAAPDLPEAIPLPAGAPFGAISVSDACTLCMSCTSACPASALKAAADAPRLSFLERNCLQCGLCANTCPEHAISLTPRLLVKERRGERVLKEAEIFHCTVCGKPMGAAPTIQNMLAKLSGHSMFASPEAIARLSMCGDCRVVDLIKHEKSVKAWEINE